MNVPGLIAGAILLCGVIIVFGHLVVDYIKDWRKRHQTFWFDWLALIGTTLGATCFMLGLSLSFKQTVAVWLGLVISQLRFQRT